MIGNKIFTDDRGSDRDSDDDYHPAASYDMDYARADFCYDIGKLTY